MGSSLLQRARCAHTFAGREDKIPRRMSPEFWKFNLISPSAGGETLPRAFSYAKNCSFLAGRYPFSTDSADAGKRFISIRFLFIRAIDARISHTFKAHRAFDWHRFKYDAFSRMFKRAKPVRRSSDGFSYMRRISAHVSYGFVVVDYIDVFLCRTAYSVVHTVVDLRVLHHLLQHGESLVFARP